MLKYFKQSPLVLIQAKFETELVAILKMAKKLKKFSLICVAIRSQLVQMHDFYNLVLISHFVFVFSFLK